MPSGSAVDEMSVMVDLTILLRQLAEDRKEEQDRREKNRKCDVKTMDDWGRRFSRRWIAELLRLVRLHLVLLVSGSEPLPELGK